MEDKKFQKAIDDFILERINNCNEPVSLIEARENLAKTYKDLISAECAKERNSINAYENAFMVLEGETIQCYYRAGFSDAVSFLLKWRDTDEIAF